MEIIVFQTLVLEEKFGMLIEDNAFVVKEKFSLIELVFLFKNIVKMGKYGIQKYILVVVKIKLGGMENNVKI